MSFFILIAVALLALAGALFFGPYFVAYGPEGFRDLVRRGDARFVSLFLIAALSFAVFASGSDPALISDTASVQLVPQDMTGPLAA